MDDLEAGRGPAAHELVGVHLRPAGVGIVEVAPGEHVHTTHAVGDDVGDQLVDVGRRAARSGTSIGGTVAAGRLRPPETTGRRPLSR